MMSEREHFWMPIPAPESKRHAFRGRQWDGSPAAESLCGSALPMARPSEMDWIQCPTCWRCWQELLERAPEPEPACQGCPHRSGRRDPETIRAELERTESP
ncbi:hypothetical protein SAMN04487904_110144 [Actinopolyspora lacussalsi subsp. righensis]|uniref:Zinc-finger n=2 Tax=Actinopolyspora righensis TaxID=995060 RepID=A0A1I7BCK2_9ACTN|nr:hypothetical protein SAMN04487904_110144 [Actinopolyspora righensis]